MQPLRAGDPTQIGSYRLVGVLGAGGMGQVFLGIGPDGRLAAVKQVLGRFAEDQDFRARFAREVDVSRMVSGAYTAAVMDADATASTPWLASVFVAGPPLDEAVEVHGPLPSSSMRLLTVGLAIALREIHRVGLVHRDLKPSNVMLTEDGPRVIDFGVATAPAGVDRLTQTGSVLGSAAYMAPEQVEGKPATSASDIFSLGAVLAYVFTGLAPFGEGSVATVLYRILNEEPDLSSVPPSLQGLIRPCLAKNPLHRPTVDQILAALGPVPPGEDWLPVPVRQMIDERREMAAQLAGVAPRPSSPPPKTPPAVPRGQRIGLALLAGGVVASIVAVIALAFWPSSPDPVEPEKVAELVLAVSPTGDDPPDGFRLNDDPATDDVVEGEPDDPLTFDRSQTAFACDRTIR